MSRTLTVQYSPSAEEAMTYMVYMNPTEVGTPYVAIDRFVYRCAAHPDVAPGTIAMNAAQRRENSKMINDPIQVFDFLVPMRDFEFKTITLRASWLKNSVNAPPPANLANIFRTTFEGFILVMGQIVTLNYEGNDVLMTVTSDGRGIVTMNSDVGVHWE